jgi:hypothetical protein
MPQSAGKPVSGPELSGNGKPGPRSPISRLGTWTILAVAVAGGLLLRNYRLGDISYWFDESFSWKMTTFPVGELLERLAGDAHPPLYFLILKSWAALFGDSPATLRFLSVLLGGLTVVGTFLMVREIYRPRRVDSADGRASGTALFAAALVSLSAFQVHWAAEMRMYSLATACVTFSTWALVKALRLPEPTWGAWLTYAATATALLYTHYYGMFSVAAQVVFTAGLLLADNRWRAVEATRDSRFFGWIVSLGLVFTAYSFWLPVFLRQRAQVQARYWVGPLTWQRLVDSFYAMFAHHEGAGHTQAEAILVTALCLLLALFLAWRGKFGDWLLLVSGFGPIVMAILVSLWDTNVFIAHYLLCAHIFLLAGIAALIGRIEPTGLRIAASGLVLAQFLWIDFHYLQRRGTEAGYPGARAAVAFIDSERRSGEIVVSACPMLTPTLEGHSRSRWGWRTLRRSFDYPHYQGTPVIRPGEYITADELDRLDASRVWVVEEKNWSWGSWPLSIPVHWKPGPSESFADIYGRENTVVVHLFYPAKSAE